MVKFLMKNIRVRKLVINDKLDFIISDNGEWVYLEYVKWIKRLNFYIIMWDLISRVNIIIKIIGC